MTAPALVDPTKQAEYPIVLGERLSSADRSRLININYNYKTKHATPKQRSTISRSARSHDLYDLSVTDKAPSADHNLTYAYKGSEDPDSERNLMLVFDPERKVFVLEPLSTKLNFNLRSAPGKTEKQVIEQYEQLRIAQEDEHTPRDDANGGTASEDEGSADEANPYDFRHFLPKEGEVKPASGHSTPEPVYTSKANTPVFAATKPPPAKPMPRPKKQANANPLRETKRPPKPQPKPKPRKPDPEPESIIEFPSTHADEPPEHEGARSPISDAGTGSMSQQTVQSPGSNNIIVDGDLIIDMGSPGSRRGGLKFNPAFLLDNEGDEGDDADRGDDGDEGDEDMESFRLPSPARNPPPPAAPAETRNDQSGDDLEEEDLLAREMEAFLEESAREEEARSHQYSQHATNRYVPSDDESEVSEEE